ncbi:MAG: DUF3429 domain-containing protein [Pseudomonadota bacterium]
MMRPRPPIPASAAALGYSGLLPFLAGAAALWSGPPWASLAGQWLLAYAAVILSFMAGVRWGLGMREDDADAGALALSVVPSLIGWAMLVPDAVLAPVFGGALPLAVRLLACAAAFILLWRWDLHAVRTGGAPGWYGALRTRLTVVVAAALIAGAASPSA